jgi:hypothetical protein
MALADAACASPVGAFASTAPAALPYNAFMRRFALSLILASAAICAGYTGYWVYLAHRLQTEIGPWAESERARGTVLAWDSLAVEGFPLVIRLHFTQATASGEKPLPFTAAAPLLLAETRVWDGRHWRVSAPDGARGALPGEAGGLAAASLDGSLGLDGSGGATIDLAAHRMAGSGIAAGIGIAAAEARLTLPDRAPGSHLDPAFAASLHLTDLSLPVTVPSFGKDVQTLSLAVTLKGALPPGRLREALAAWRQDGGTIELTDGALRWGALNANANGTFALDDQLQPIGALTATIENHNAIIDAAVAGGTLRAGDANLVKLLLGLMAKPGADGRKRLTLPVSLQNDRLYLGPAQIAALPRFTWE